MGKIRKVLVVLLVIIITSSCNEKVEFERELDNLVDEDDMYIGFSEQNVDYTPRDAKKDGYFTLLDLETYANKDEWEKFLKRVEEGGNADLRFYKFMSSESTYLSSECDIYRHDGHFFLFESATNKLEQVAFKYLLTVESKNASGRVVSSITILANTEDVTYGDIVKGFIGNDSEVIDRIGPIKILF